MTTFDLKPAQLFEFYETLRKDFITRVPSAAYPEYLKLLDNVVVRRVTGKIVVYSLALADFYKSSALGHFGTFICSGAMFDDYTFTTFLGSRDRLLREYFRKHNITVLNV